MIRAVQIGPIDLVSAWLDHGLGQQPTTPLERATTLAWCAAAVDTLADPDRFAPRFVREGDRAFLELRYPTATGAGRTHFAAPVPVFGTATIPPAWRRNAPPQTDPREWERYVIARALRSTMRGMREARQVTDRPTAGWQLYAVAAGVAVLAGLAAWAAVDVAESRLRIVESARTSRVLQLAREAYGQWRDRLERARSEGTAPAGPGPAETALLQSLETETRAQPGADRDWLDGATRAVGTFSSALVVVGLLSVAAAVLSKR